MADAPTSRSRWKLYVFAAALFAFYLVWFTGSVTNPPARPAATRAAPPVERAGTFQQSRVTAVRQGNDWTAMFDPHLATDNETLLASIRFVFNDLAGIPMGRVDPPRIVGDSFLRYITGGGVFDAMPIKDGDSGRLAGVTLIKR